MGTDLGQYLQCLYPLYPLYPVKDKIPAIFFRLFCSSLSDIFSCNPCFLVGTVGTAGTGPENIGHFLYPVKIGQWVQWVQALKTLHA